MDGKFKEGFMVVVVCSLIIKDKQHFEKKNICYSLVIEVVLCMRYSEELIGIRE